MTSYAVAAGALPSFQEADWATRLLSQLWRRAAAAAALAVLVVAISATLPAWTSSVSGPTAPSSADLTASSEVTGSASTRVEDLAVTSFVDRIPFVQQAHYLNALDGASEAERLVEGARQAQLASYVDAIGGDILPGFLSDAATIKKSVDLWQAAAGKAETQAATEQDAAAAAGPSFGGARIPATVTFYACLGNGFCGMAASGQQVFAGAAACSFDLPLGTRFVIANDPTGRVFVCVDRGALAPTWVDVWFYSADEGYAWLSSVGSYSEIILLN
ncbi:MAG: hypothetical protein U1B78_00865 [Dehalococcoidia bacterium]|nr:hypothetical protein [Dehalococcoidia bacterium]